MSLFGKNDKAKHDDEMAKADESLKSEVGEPVVNAKDRTKDARSESSGKSFDKEAALHRAVLASSGQKPTLCRAVIYNKTATEKLAAVITKVPAELNDNQEIQVCVFEDTGIQFVFATFGSESGTWNWPERV